MTLEELRERIDVLDQRLVELLNERARAALLIGHLKAATSLPVYEPAREKVIYNNVRDHNKAPQPFQWVATANTIIKKVRKYKRILETGH